MVDWHLLPGEKPIHETKMSRVVFWKYYLFILVILGIATEINIFNYEAYGIFLLAETRIQISEALIIIAAIVTIIAERFTTREMVLLTTDRILLRKRGLNDEDMDSGDVRKGITSTFGSIRMEALKLETITNVQVRQTMGHRISGVGDLAILAGNEEHVVKDLHHPFDIEKAIYRIIEKRKEAQK